jgi:hypothetical protein
MCSLHTTSPFISPGAGNTAGYGAHKYDAERKKVVRRSSLVVGRRQSTWLDLHRNRRDALFLRGLRAHLCVLCVLLFVSRSEPLFICSAND